jgi:organic radical activating enzyme
MLTTEELAAQLLEASDRSFFKFPANPTHLIFTGGEPLLGWQRAYVELIEELRKQDPVWSEHPELLLPITFETNGTRHLELDKKSGAILINDITKYCDITWSISAKLSPSGHTTDEAILPDVVAEYLQLHHDNAYFKFVIQSPADLDEVDAAVARYKQAGIDIPVFIMPAGGTLGEYKKHSTVELVGEAVKRGYNITPRLQVLIGDNSQSW